MKRGAGAIPDFTVETVIALVSFIILLGVLGAIFLHLQDSSDDDVCTLSVLARGTAPQSAQALVPLKCQTKKTCFTCEGCDKKKACEESFAGEKGVRMITLPSEKGAAKTLIERETAEAYYRCWKKMGQGKLSLFGTYLTSRGLTVGKSVCVMCDRLAIDKGVSSDVLTQLDIHGYMRDTPVPEHKETYLELFTNGQVKSYPQVSVNDYAKDKEGAPRLDGLLPSDRQVGIVFMQIQSTAIEEALGHLSTDGLIVAGGAFFTPAGRAGTKLIGVLPAKGVKSLSVISIAVALATAGFAATNAYSSQIVAGGYCGAFAGNEEGTKGCSLFQLMPYKVSWINQLCSGFDGEA